MREERVEKRKIRRRNFWIRTAVILFLAGVVVFAVKAPLFNVTDYEVTGNVYYTQDEIINMGNCKTGENIFIGTDYKDIKARLLRDAYIKDVDILRHLPSTVEIVISERTQTAALVYGEQFVVLDSEGVALRKTSVDPRVTVISGVTITGLEIGKPVEVSESLQLRQALELIDVTNANNMYFKRIDMSSIEIRAHVLDNLICKGTLDNLKAGLENNTVQIIVQELFDRNIERGTVKITTDGFASYSPEI